MQVTSHHLGISQRQQALLDARAIDNLAQQGRIQECRGVLALFPTQLPGERVLASMYYVLSAKPAERVYQSHDGDCGDHQGREHSTGTGWVSTHGLYLRFCEGMEWWRWSDLVAAEMTAPGRMTFAFRAKPWRRYRLASDWAELVFTCWARSQNPRHAQYRTGAWLPVGELPSGADDAASYSLNDEAALPVI